MSEVTIGGRPVNRIGFGAMQLPGPGVFGPPRDHDAAIAVLRRAIELGVDHIDTSQYYGPDVANALIREALHPYPSELVLVSKVGARRDEQGAWLPWEQPADLRQGVEDNLAALEIDRLDAVNLRAMDEGHGPEGYESPPFDDQLDAMIEMRDEGIIGGIGLSNIGLERLEHALERTEITCVQNPFNLLSQDGRDVLDLCAEHGIAYVPFFPLGSAMPGMAKVTDHPPVIETAQRLGVTPAQVGLAWVLAQGENVLLIPGTSSIAHLEENMGAGDVTLDDEALAALR